MAEITVATTGKRKKQNLRVDLTPMVDLGFLLISFFVFTTTLAEPKVLSLILPDEHGPYTKIPESGAVTIIAAADKIYYYMGQIPSDAGNISQVNYSDIGSLRVELIQLKQRLIRANGNDEKLMVLIKPGENSQMGQLVDLLDEMMICDIKRYSIGELQLQEKMLLKTT